MIYRSLDENLDYTFGQNGKNFLVDSPAAVGQAILTSLSLFQGEWWLDTSKGVPWYVDVLGRNTSGLYDQTIQAAIIDTEGVTNIESYDSELVQVSEPEILVTSSIGWGGGGWGTNQGGWGGVAGAVSFIDVMKSRHLAINAVVNTVYGTISLVTAVPLNESLI